ncbi:hypothetical protein NM688_g4213 [Phlebia brevispora]|uniref:Uncharacterized protein n=1 Tax=Phlebia brevispora TaxID=194682 RepID=A0ACC1T396_9APHY|nr:hypothetical protein NM688_g4213 [Phlebia brevispora]
MASEVEKKRFYDVLGLSADASQEAIRAAYRHLALQWHPDRNQHDKHHAQQKFIEIKEAYLALLDESKTRPRSKARRGKTAPPPSASTAAPSSTPSECGSNPEPSPPPSHQKHRTRLNKRTAKAEEHYAPHTPTTSTSSSSSSQSESSAARFQHHVSYLKIERDVSGEERSEPYGQKQKSVSLEDDDYEFVDLVDLGTPLLPLRLPIRDVAKDWVFPLPLSLEDLYHGRMQHYRITRTLISGRTQAVKIDIKVSPSWRSGTRMRVPDAGNQLKDGSFQDIVFVVKEIPHPRFTRVGNDLILSVNVPWANVPSSPYPFASAHARNPSQGQEVYVRALNGEEYALPIPRTLVEGADGTRIVGAGMPVQTNGESTGKGDLLIRWVFAFPEADKTTKSSSWTTFRRAMIRRT